MASFNSENDILCSDGAAVAASELRLFSTNRGMPTPKRAADGTPISGGGAARRMGSLTVESAKQESINIDAEIVRVMNKLRARDPNEKEYLQAVSEAMKSLEVVFAQQPKYLKVFELLCEPERVIMFRVPWIDDCGQMRINRGFRVQYSSAIGPYKGGLRFHPSVSLSILKFLGFEQTFKNSLTGLTLGGAKGGSDFDPHDKSDTEIRSFCQAFMGELFPHIGPATDVPAGDIGVGEREIGFLFGAYKKLSRTFEGSLTGKNPNWGGSFIRPEATGYGAVYFTEELLRDRLKLAVSSESPLKGMRCVVSGAGNAAQYTAEKLLELGAKVLTLSDSNGTVLEPQGFTSEQLKQVMELKNVRRGRMSEYKSDTMLYFPKIQPHGLVECDIDFPAATQNEIGLAEATLLAEKKCRYVMEVANMPSNEEAIDYYKHHGIVYGPSKAVNAGGVAVSGLEMAQNSMLTKWSREEVDGRLKAIMNSIYNNISSMAERYGCKEDLQVGANIAGFLKVADALIAEGAS